MKDKIKLICVVGPTASGKSSLAMELAQKFDGEIINADSRQFYKELNIGTAKPSLSDRKIVTHHLIDCATILEPWTVARFVSQAHIHIQKTFSNNKLPIIVGGTGLYVKSLLYGLNKIPEINPKVRDKLKTELEGSGLAYLYKELEHVDPETAKKLPPNDKQRIMRALEVYRQTGRKIHEYWKQDIPKSTYDFIKIAIRSEREVLYDRINKRVEVMFENGLKNEVHDLSEKFFPNTILEKTIGYAEWLEFGFDNDEQVLDAIQKNSRHFAKRQLTWFRNEDDVNWLEDKKVEVDKFVEKFLNNKAE